MKIKSISALLFSATCVLTGCSGGNNTQTAEITQSKRTQLTAETSSLLDLLKKIPEKGYIVGHQDATLYGIGWEFEQGRSDVQSVCGDYPAMVAFEIGDIERGIDKSLDSVPFDAIRAEAVNQYKRGGIVSISWHANNPKSGSNSWDISAGNVVETVLPGGVNHELLVRNIDVVADFLSSIKDEKGTKVPVLFRPWHEHTGSWFWWGADHCTAGEYKALWDMTMSRMREKGVDNVLYIYSSGATTEEKYLERFPDKDYIDLIGFDHYQFKDINEDDSYLRDMNSNLTFLTRLSKEMSKPMAIAETGYEQIKDDKWWTGVLAPLCENYPIDRKSVV